jgi:hypothetical protein
MANSARTAPKAELAFASLAVTRRGYARSLDPDPTELDQGPDFRLSMILSKNRVPLFGIMLRTTREMNGDAS